MEEKHRSELKRINYFCSEMEAVYHQAAIKLGVPDSVMMVLYAIYDLGDGCLLSDVCKNSGVSRQTINSAVRGLERDGILYLEPYNGKLKRLRLTEKGREYADAVAGRLYRAEMDAFDTWSGDEIETYIRLMEKYKDCLKRQLEKM